MAPMMACRGQTMASGVRHKYVNGDIVVADGPSIVSVFAMHNGFCLFYIDAACRRSGTLPEFVETETPK
jgi:hypothetical protein